MEPAAALVGDLEIRRAEAWLVRPRDSGQYCALAGSRGYIDMDGIERGYLDVDSSIYIWMLDRSPNRR